MPFDQTIQLSTWFVVRCRHELSRQKSIPLLSVYFVDFHGSPLLGQPANTVVDAQATRSNPRGYLRSFYSFTTA